MAVRIKNKKKFIIANMTLLITIFFVVKVTVFAAKTIGKLVKGKSKYTAQENDNRSKNGNIKIDYNDNFIRYTIKLKSKDNFLSSKETNKNIKLIIDKTEKLSINAASTNEDDKYIKFTKSISGNVLTIKKLNSDNNFVYEPTLEKNITVLISKKSSPFSNKVVLDPGHGGNDRGAKAMDGSFKEKDKTLTICKELREKLTYEGCKVIMTRTQDDYISLDDRVNISKKNNPKAFVAIHIDADKASSEYSGVTVHYYNNYNNELSQRSSILANTIDDSIATDSDWKNRKAIYGENYYVLKFNSVPSVLIECGFATNSGDVERLNSNKTVDKLANCIAKGIVEYLNK